MYSIYSISIYVQHKYKIYPGYGKVSEFKPQADPCKPQTDPCKPQTDLCKAQFSICVVLTKSCEKKYFAKKLHKIPQEKLALNNNWKFRLKMNNTKK